MMNFDPDNNIVKLCARGMSMEAEGDPKEAANLFIKAWEDSTTDLEKFISAHYVARHQNAIEDKLTWDEKALHYGLKLQGPEIKAYFPSLYLNVGKCYEDLKDFDAAKKHYQSALSYLEFLPEDGYGKMISSGVRHGLQRVDAF